MKCQGYLLTLIALFFISSLLAQTHEVLLSTNKGDITITLYDDTAEHTAQFMRLVNSGHFDGTLFYRVIKNFVAQGGSSDSRNAVKGKHIGYGSSKMVIDAEFREDRIHKRGALCAPRQPDAINMFKKSDISQFYIVDGKKYTNEELDIIEKNHNVPIKRALKVEYYLPQKDTLAVLKTTDPVAYNRLLREIKEKINFEFGISNKLQFTDYQRQQYTTIGGIPDLDGKYTVFGEISAGLEVLSAITSSKTDKNDRPLSDVSITIKVLK